MKGGLKVSRDDVELMRKAYGEGATQGALARRFGISVGQVGRIVRGEAWQEVTNQRALRDEEADAILRRLLKAQGEAVLRQAAEAPTPDGEDDAKRLARERGWIEGCNLGNPTREGWSYHHTRRSCGVSHGESNHVCNLYSSIGRLCIRRGATDDGEKFWPLRNTKRCGSSNKRTSKRRQHQSLRS